MMMKAEDVLLGALLAMPLAVAAMLLAEMSR